MKTSRGLWKTRFGFYLASVGSAFGLGNLWRFPYIVSENGGGAFVLLYVFCAFAIGMPLLIAELMLGKLSRKSSVAAILGLGFESPRWHCFASWTSRFTFVAALFVFAYYAVISGWVLHFLMQFLVSPIRSGNFDPSGSLSILMQSGFLQIALTSVHILVVAIVVMKGVQEGIEKWVGGLVPVFAVLLLILIL